MDAMMQKGVSRSEQLQFVVDEVLTTEQVLAIVNDSGAPKADRHLIRFESLDDEGEYLVTVRLLWLDA
jgi:hypothetical protein